MKVILLSGGSGKRLWPMSSDNSGQAKQFLKLIPGTDGRPASMLQRVWSQLGEADLQSTTYICAPTIQHSIIKQQVGEVNLIEEPCGRDTFPAIALSVAYLAAVEPCGDEIFTVLPVDPFVDTQYFETVVSLDRVLRTSEANLVLMGVPATKPTSKYGYIQTSGDVKHGETGFQVKGFIEKPNHQLAEHLVKEGALWNCGVFCFRQNWMLERLRALGYPTDYGELHRMFANLPKRSFDREIVEDTQCALVVPYRGVWEDIGEWDTLTAKMRDSLQGIGVMEQCNQTHVINELPIPIVTLGLDKAVVVATSTGILIADKEHSTDLKRVLQRHEIVPPSTMMHTGPHNKSVGALDIQDMFSFIAEKSENIISCFSPDGLFTYVSPAVTALLGYTPDEVIGKPAAEFNHPETNEALMELHNSLTTDQHTQRFTGRLRHKNGEYRWYETTVQYIRDESGAIVQTIGVGRDITDRKEAEAKIEHLAYHDTLTDLPNRRLFKHRISAVLGGLNQEHHGLMLVDLDGFKHVNDTFGHDVGDLLLIEVANRLIEAAGENNMVARLGGDEFTILRTSIEDERDWVRLIERVKEVMSQQISIEGHTLSVTASIGAAL